VSYEEGGLERMLGLVGGKEGDGFCEAEMEQFLSHE